MYILAIVSPVLHYMYSYSYARISIYIYIQLQDNFKTIVIDCTLYGLCQIQ